MWIDADAWCQRWDAVAAYIELATRHSIVVTPEMDRCYRSMYRLNNTMEVFESYIRAGYGSDLADKISRLPILNSGVFSMLSSSPVWADWSAALDHALRQHPLDHLTEQTALNVAVYAKGHFPSSCFLPATYNWCCVQALPAFNVERGVYVEPSFPHREIGIIHLTGVTSRRKLDAILDTAGNPTSAPLRYSGPGPVLP
jgi:hypothetical protein